MTFLVCLVSSWLGADKGISFKASLQVVILKEGSGTLKVKGRSPRIPIKI